MKTHDYDTLPPALAASVFALITALALCLGSAHAVATLLLRVGL